MSNFAKSFAKLITLAAGGRAVGFVAAELNHAKKEVQGKAVKLGVGGVLIAVAIVVLGFSLVFLSIAAFIGLSNVVAPWAAALIVGGAYLLITIILVLIGVSLLKKNKTLYPTESVDNIKRFFGGV